MKSDAIPWVETTATFSPGQARRTARAATLALHDELSLYPKPGLVSFQDAGSHADMDASVLFRSLSCLRHYFRSITLAGSRGAAFAELEALGISAEQRMLVRTQGVNTHRGAIFILGLLCAAAGGLHAEAGPLCALHIRQALVARWSSDLFARQHAKRCSHGRQAVQAFHLRGIEQEAALGFPILFEVTSPTLRQALDDGLSRQGAHLQAFFQTLAVLDDTNLAHRGGLVGLRWAQTEARRFLNRGGMHQSDAIAQAETIHHAFVQRRLSPGGCADLLSAACWVERMAEVA